MIIKDAYNLLGILLIKNKTNNKTLQKKSKNL
jgi:hypothetical protein